MRIIKAFTPLIAQASSLSYDRPQPRPLGGREAGVPVMRPLVSAVAGAAAGLACGAYLWAPREDPDEAPSISPLVGTYELTSCKPTPAGSVSGLMVSTPGQSLRRLHAQQPRMRRYPVPGQTVTSVLHVAGASAKWDGLNANCCEERYALVIRGLFGQVVVS